MRITVVGKNVEITKAMRDITEEKILGLRKYYAFSEDTEVRVLARVYNRNMQKIEVTVPGTFGVLRAETTANDYYDALNGVIGKLQGQIRKHKTHMEKRHRKSLGELVALETVDKTEDAVSRTKMVVAESMSVDEAVAQMDLSGHDFYIFTNEDTGRHAVLYRRKGDTFGLLDIA